MDSSKSSKFGTDLSKGSVAKQLLIFAIPFIISNLIQSLYNVADMIIVGQFAGTASMSGVNIGGQLTFLLTNLVIGLSTGATVLIGQYLGHGDRKELNETVSTLFTTLLISALFLTAVMIFARDPLLKLIETPPESYQEAKEYLTVTAIGTLFIFGYNAFSAIFRGMGDSKRPLMFVAVACGVNVVLDLLFVGLFGMKAFGAALATVISQAASMLLCIVYFRKTDFVFDFTPKSFKISKERLKVLLKVGLPMSIQNTITSVSFLVMTALVNHTGGYVASAAVGVVGKFNGFAIMPAIAISASISAMSAQNFGAGESKRAVKTMGIGLILAFAMSAAVFTLTRIFPEQILRIFDNDEALINAGMAYMSTFSFDYIIVPFFFSMNGLFIGSGHTMISLINNITSALLVRVPVAYIFGVVFDMGLLGIGLGAPVASAMSVLICGIYFISGRWKKSAVLTKNVSNESV